jgi:hypothetical protein
VQEEPRGDAMQQKLSKMKGIEGTLRENERNERKMTNVGF